MDAKTKKKSLKVLLVSFLLTCVSILTVYAINCDLTCPICGSKNINHYHPNHGVACEALCRDCRYRWYEENPPIYKPSEEEEQCDHSLL